MTAAKGSPDYVKEQARGNGADMYDLMPAWPSASTKKGYGAPGLGHGDAGGAKIAPKKTPKKNGFKKAYSKDHPANKSGVNSLDDIRAESKKRSGY